MARRKAVPRVPPRLLIHGADPVKWAQRWGIDIPEPVMCDCGRLKRCDVPYAQGDWRGIQASPCVCGDGSVAPYCVVHRDGIPFENWPMLGGPPPPYPKS